MGGGGFTAGVDDPALDELVLHLTERPRPRICLLPTAGGDSEHQIRRFFETYGDRLCEPSHISRFRLGRKPVKGLGFLPFSNAVHYEDKPERRSAYRLAIADGMPAGYGTGDGAALHFVDDGLARVVTSRPTARAYHVASDGGDVTETELATHFLGAPVAVEPALAA